MYTLIYTCCLGLACLALEVINLRRWILPCIVLGLAAIFYVNYMDWDVADPVVIGGMDMSHMMRVDAYSVAFSGLAIFTSILFFMLTGDFYRSERNHLSDYLAILIFILVGALVLFTFSNLVMLFLGVEIVSISSYIMAGSRRFDARSNEAGFKYFLMGSFASAILLFGIALIYGASGTFQIDGIAAQVLSENTLMQAGMIMVTSAFLFKVAAVPFHFWSPDVYEGSPTLITAFMSTLVKVAFFAAFYRLLASGMPMLDFNEDILSIVAGLTMIIGNLIALHQTNFKRLLAYSGISHAGYMLLAIISIRTDASGALFFYAATYVMATLGAFAIAIPVFYSRGNETIEAFNGLGKKNPWLAFFMTLCMLSLAGIPPLAGFLGKYYIFSEAVQNGHIALTVLAVLSSIVGVYYYFKVILAMYATETVEYPVRPVAAYWFVILVCAIVSVLLGIYPGVISLL